MTSERSSVGMHAARALLAAASFAALAGCSVRQERADAPRDATASNAAALDGTVATIPRFHHAAVELGGGRALVCGGRNTTNEPFPPNCELLELQAGSLKATVFRFPEVPAQGRLAPSLTLLPTGGVLLAGGWPGANAQDLRSAVASRPISDWLQAGDVPSSNWLSPETMSVAREGQTATLLGTSVVVFGGANRSKASLTAAIDVRTGAGVPWTTFDPAGQAGLVGARTGHTATLLKPDGSEARVLVLGGYDNAQAGFLRSGFIFSFEDGVKPIPDMPGEGRMNHTATLLDDDHGSVLVMGGEGADPSSAFSDAWRYDPVTKEWSSAGAASAPGAIAPRPRRFHSAVRLGNYVIVAGGMGPGTPANGATPAITDGPALTSVQSYDWKHGTWSDLRPLSEARAYLQLLKLDETHLVASGGSTDIIKFPETSELITLLELGQHADDAQSCASGHLADEVCCESDCKGPCQACDEHGLCQPLSGTPRNGHGMCGGNLLCADGDCPAHCASTNDCVAGTFCDAKNDCVELRGLGGSCETQAQCANGVPCAGKVCCESVCNGPCEACDSKGTCRPLDAGAKPVRSDPSCAAVPDGDPQCAAQCDGITTARCVFPGSSSLCSAASCGQDGLLRSASACDGHGACQAVTVDECAPYTCNQGASQCWSTCGNSGGTCSPGAHCEKDRCLRCDDSNDKQCHGFRCDTEADECKRTCQRSADCTGGYYCHPLEHRCVASVPFPASQLPACTMGRGRVGDRGLAIAAAAWLLFSAWRRRFNPKHTRSRTRSL